MEKWYENLKQYELKAFEKYAAHGEEGVFEHLFKYLPNHKYCIEFGAMNGIMSSNTRWLIDEYKWGSLLLEGSRKHPNNDRKYGIKREWIIPDNIVSLFDKYSVPDDIDLISVDIDSMDYYICEKILESKYRPTLMIIEYNPNFYLSEAKIRPYDPEFRKDRSTFYGASLTAYINLHKKYGYELLHVLSTPENSSMKYGRNAIFIKKEYIPSNFSFDLSVVPEHWVEGTKYAPKSELSWVEQKL